MVLCLHFCSSSGIGTNICQFLDIGELRFPTKVNRAEQMKALKRTVKNSVWTGWILMQIGGGR